MSKVTVVLAALLLVGTVVSIARADENALRTALQGRYSAMKTAMAAHDDKAMAALLTPDFVSIDISGNNEDAPQMIREVDSLSPDPDKVSTTTILSLRSNGKGAIVEQRYDMRTIKVGADGSRRTIRLATFSTDTWLKVIGEWFLQKTETTQLDYYVDGQLVEHKAKSSG